MRWLVRIFVTLILVVLLAVGAVLLIPTDRVAGLAVKEFKRLTGRDLALSGTSAPSFWPTFGVKTGPIAIANAGWSDKGPMIEAEALDISLDMSALLSGDIRIKGISALRPVIRLERNATGQANWEFGGSGSTAGGGSNGEITAATPGVGKSFTLEQAAFEGGTLIWSDATTGAELELANLTGTLAIPDFEGAATASLTGQRGGQDFAADLTLGAFRPFLDGQEVPLGLKLVSGPASIGFTGSAGRAPLRGSGALAAELADLQAISALFAQSPPDLPEGFGRRQIDLTGQVAFAEGPDLRLSETALVLDGTPFSLSARLSPGPDRPFLTAHIAAGRIELGGAPAAASGGDGGPAGQEAGSPPSGWSRAPIDVSVLRRLDADVTLQTGPIRLGNLSLAALAAHARNDRGRLTIELQRAEAYGGTATGQIVVNARKALSTSADLTLSQIALKPMLGDLAGYDRLAGKADARLAYVAAGTSLDALMRSLEGSGAVSVGQGELIGADLAAMLITLDASQYGRGQKTIFDSLTGSFTIAGGVLANDDFRMTSPRVTAQGNGTVGVGDQTLDYRLRATALADDAGQGGLTAPLLIYGSWADPRFTIDIEALARDGLSEDLGGVEDRAKAQLQDQLGIDRAPDESLEDAARRKLEEELGKGLIDLFGGN